MSTRYLLVGLGNPGQEYANTRHNAGFWLVDGFAELHHCSLLSKTKFSGQFGQVEINGDSWIVLKPTAYMNRSGIAVHLVSQYYNISSENILIVHDELDFEAGTIRFKSGGSHGGHNGLRDIINQLGAAGFARLRVGIGRGADMATYVLKTPSKLDRSSIDSALPDAINLVPDLMGVNRQKAVQHLHSR
ncbi:MAG: aminoacyl-tRNA hydrolase [Methylococcales bacterium]